MLADLANTIATFIGIFVALLGAFLFAFWIAMGIWTFNDIRNRTRDWLAIGLASLLVLIFPLIGLILYTMIRPRETLADIYDRALEEEALLRELEVTLTCHSCGVPVQESWNFCANCHSQLRFGCPTCGKPMRHEWSICVSCGADQPDNSSAADRPSQSGERAEPIDAAPPVVTAQEDAAYRPVQMTEQGR